MRESFCACNMRAYVLPSYCVAFWHSLHQEPFNKSEIFHILLIVFKLLCYSILSLLLICSFFYGAANTCEIFCRFLDFVIFSFLIFLVNVFRKS